jgi:hypothetical protein
MSPVLMLVRGHRYTPDEGWSGAETDLYVARLASRGPGGYAELQRDAIALARHAGMPAHGDETPSRAEQIFRVPGGLEVRE